MSTSDAPAHDVVAALRTALAADRREAFTSLLANDFRWGGERGANVCTSRDQAGDHYAALLAAGVTLHIDEITDLTSDGTLIARVQVTSPDPDMFPTQVTVRLTVRDGLIANILELDPPPTIELLYFDGCPHHEGFLPHLHRLLADHGITTPVTLVHIDSGNDAVQHRFLGSPTLRVNGRDVDPAASARDTYGLQCRLYLTADGPRGTPPDEWILDALIDNPRDDAAINAVRTGDVVALQRLVAEHPDLAARRLPRHEHRTLLHVATDWPRHYPNVAASITVLVSAGADPNAAFLVPHAEAPLHWAASSGDIEAIDALLDNDADINAPGDVIANGTPLADATAFGQWDAARRLLECGARTNLFEAARSASSPRSRSTSAARLPVSTKSPAASGEPATAGTSAPRLSNSTTAPTSTGSATTTSRRWMPPTAAKPPTRCWLIQRGAESAPHAN